MRPFALAAGLALAGLTAAAPLCAQTTAGAAALRTPQSFDTIRDRTERSRALFVEAGKVLQSPRCLNCHPKGDRPTQGEDLHLHVPPIVRGPAGWGPPGMTCLTCHQKENYEPSGVPGHPLWHLAPRSMAWQQQTLGQICAQIKDRKRNGGKSLDEIREHMAHDTLVGWGWAPGGNRQPAPGTQKEFGALIDAWVATGAACPR